MANYAYIRVSTKEQNIDRQLIALEPYNIPTKNIFCDWQSGKDFERPAYQKLLKRIKSGDLIIVKSIPPHSQRQFQVRSIHLRFQKIRKLPLVQLQRI